MFDDYAGEGCRCCELHAEDCDCEYRPDGRCHGCSCCEYCGEDSSKSIYYEVPGQDYYCCSEAYAADKGEDVSKWGPEPGPSA